MFSYITTCVLALGVLLLQSQAAVMNSLMSFETVLQDSPRLVTPGREKFDVPLGVAVKPTQSSIRMGDPIVFQYRFVNYSSNNSYIFLLPDQGKPWLTLHLRDKSGREVGSASLMDFAGAHTVRAITLQNRQPLLWTRFYLERTSGGGSNSFSDEIVLDTISSASLTPGSYTITADLSLPYAVESSGRKRETLSYGFPYETASEKRGTVVINERTGGEIFVPAPFDPSLPVVPKAAAEIHKTNTVSLVVRDETVSIHRETEALAARIIAAYPAPLPNLPPQAIAPSQVRPADSPQVRPRIYGVTRVPYNLQFRERITSSRRDIQTLFSLNSLDAKRAQLSVAKTIADASSTGNNYRIGLGMFYQNVGLVGTTEVVNFLANQGWERGRPEAFKALATMHEYGSLRVRQRVKEHFASHQAKVPRIIGNTGS